VSWRFGDFELDPATRELRRGAETVPLAPKAFRLLALLLERHPAAVSRQDIRDVLWPDTVVADSNLPSLVWGLREAIEDRPPGRLLRTVRGFGYAFSGKVERVGPGAQGREARGRDGPRLVWGDQAYPLGEGVSIVGRDPEAAVFLDAPSVSRRHARLVLQGPRVLLEDLQSKNGTSLNGEPVHGVLELRDGDEIRLGSVQLLFRSRGVGQPTATVPG
jgi:DNA-binding winged helix-turn-helix (wHTH) protein